MTSVRRNSRLWIVILGVALVGSASVVGLGGWSLTGNIGTSTFVNFLGTRDNQALEIRVNNVRALRIAPHESSPNLIGGFHENTVAAGVWGATISGGGRDGAVNQITRFAHLGTVGGGGWNTVSAYVATVGGGWSNTASGFGATVSGGRVNTASGDRSTVSGGKENTASGEFSTVAGGRENVAAGSWSFVVGRKAKNADTTHHGVFMFADSTNRDFMSTAANQFNVRASGGYRLFTSPGLTTGVKMSAGSNSWSGISDRAVKDNFSPVDTLTLLEALAGVPVLTWNLQDQYEEMRHIGPVAQDFNQGFAYLFGEVESPVHINTMDAVGVSLAASQGLYTLVREQADQIAQLSEEVDDLRTRLEALEALVQRDRTP